MKRIFKIVALGIALAVVLIIIRETFQIEEDVFIRGYWIIAVIVVIGGMLINVLYNIYYQRKMSKLVTLLEAGKPEEYTVGVEALLQTAKGQDLRNILQLNLAAGYIDRKQYNRAVQILEELPASRLKGSAAKLVYRLNLCMGYFYAAEYEKAMCVYQESQEIFKAHRNDKNYGGNVAITDIIAAVYEKRYDQAEQLLAAARESWKNPRLQDAFQNLSGLIAQEKTKGA